MIIRSHINQLIIYQVEFLYTWLCNYCTTYSKLTVYAVT